MDTKSTIRQYSKQEQSVANLLIKVRPDLKFEKIRPDFLKNPKTGRNLELDFYCKKKKIAIEIQGIQHEKYVPFFHRTYENYLEQLKNDKFKEIMCKKHGIKLIKIWYDESDKNIGKKLKKLLKEESLFSKIFGIGIILLIIL